MKRTATILLLALSASLTVAGRLPAQETGDSEQFVSRAEYDELRQQLDALRSQMQQLIEAKSQPAAPVYDSGGGGGGGKAVLGESVAEGSELEGRVSALEESTQLTRPGSTGFLLSGYSFGGYNNLSGQNSSFNAGLNPIFLWRHGDNLLFEGELELAVEDNETEVELEYAQLSWIANDYLTFGVGKFLNPSNYFAERLHPAWINKLPSAPLPFGHDGLMAGTQLGVQARGGIPIGSTRASYAVYLSNGPSLNVGDGDEGGGHGGSEVGTLDYNNYSDLNNSKAVGGRVGFRPIPALEIGYGVEFANVAPSGSGYNNIDALTQSVDASYVKNSSLLKGQIDARAQLVWLSIDNPGVEPLDFGNDSSGGYFQLAYRPIELDNRFLKNLEPVARYDWIDRPGDTKSERMSFGLNYWFDASTVLKASYEFGTDKEDGDSSDLDGFRIQASMGF